MVTLGRPSLLAWLVGGLLGHDLRLVAPAELPPERGARSFDLRRCHAGLLHARVRLPQLGLGLASQAVERFATRAWQLPARPVALGQAGDAAQRARAAAAAELLRCVAMGGAKELATAAEAAGLPPAGLLDTLLGDLLQAAPCATTQTPAPATTQRPVRPRMRHSRDSANISRQ